MERTEFQQMMAELKEQNERRRYDALRKKYAIAPDFTNMSLYDELGVRYDLDELEQLKQKFGMTTDMPIDNALTERMNKQEMKTTSAANPRHIPEILGELAADTKIAYDYWRQMNQTGKQLVKTFGPDQGADIDNYYHPLLQCQLAKISPTSRDWGLRLGYAKEIWDYHKKKGTMPMSEISADSRKDLLNNLYGSNLGYNNPNKSCWELLDDKRTPNMRKANIR